MRALTCVVLASALGIFQAPAQSLNGKKVLYINSYHKGYSWSDDLEKSILQVLTASGVEVKVVALDTYRQKTPEHLVKVSEEAKNTIEQWKPNVVIVSDDPAIKGVYAQHFKDKTLPFVFCGVNWDASAYGVPAKNITGMVEVCPINELLSELNKLKAGKRLGYLSADSLTPTKDLEMISKMLGTKMEARMAKDFAAWKQGFLELQTNVDCLIIGVNAGISDWNEQEAVKFVEQNAKVISGSYQDFLNGLSMLAFNKLASEQGEWAAEAAIKIMTGTAPSAIPLAKNERGELVLNSRIAEKLGIIPPFELLQSARIIE